FVYLSLWLGHGTSVHSSAYSTRVRLRQFFPPHSCEYWAATCRGQSGGLTFAPQPASHQHRSLAYPRSPRWIPSELISSWLLTTSRLGWKPTAFWVSISFAGSSSRSTSFAGASNSLPGAGGSSGGETLRGRSERSGRSPRPRVLIATNDYCIPSAAFNSPIAAVISLAASSF